MTTTLLTISELAADLGIKASAIRFYEHKGLIKPERTPGNHRVYAGHDRARLKLILRGRRFGATIEQIADMIGPAGEAVNESAQIDKSVYYINLKMQDIEKQRGDLEQFEDDLRALKRTLLKRKRAIGNA